MKTGDQKVKQLIKALLIGCGCGIAVCGLLLTSAAAVFASMECIVYPALGPITLVAAVLGGVFAGYVSARIIQRMGLIVGTGAASGMVLLFLLSGLLLCGGQELSLPAALTKAIAILLAGAVGGAAGVGKKQKIRRR